jgi:hypothetical protein
MRDTMGYIVAAYAITWVALIAYAVRLHRVSQRARTEYHEASRDASAPGRRES